MKRLDTVETLADAVKRRPVFEPVFRAFSPLLERRAALSGRLVDAMEKAAPRLPVWDSRKGQEGTPLFTGADLEALSEFLEESVREMLPEVSRLTAIQGHTAALESFFQREGAVMGAAQALMDGDGEALEALASGAGLPPAVLAFALESVLGPVLRAAVLCMVPQHAVSPWDERPASWMQGWCPVCGASPSIGYLEEKTFDEKNAFASGGGGRKHLHCSLCGTEWHFRRGACPSCGKEGSGTLEILRQTEGARGERVEWCTHCRTYSPVVDLRERDTRPDMDAQALSMMHLDMVAAEKGLKPLNLSFWNQF